MNFKALFNKLKRPSEHGRCCFLVIQPDAVYVSSSTEVERRSKFEVADSNWEKALEQALSAAATMHGSLVVVLSHHLYQMYQIDKPAMPRQEWPAALPFLLKELTSERATDIVADAVQLPNSTKVQTYVLPKKTLDKIRLLASRAQLSLEAILPEDELWGEMAGELGNFLLLQRSVYGHFRISAFVEHTIAFHRSIRSVTPPLTRAPSSELQIDSLSLELQRSIDYLSAQLRQVPLHQLKVCCDEEDENELIQSLNLRLSTNVSSLFPEQRELSGHVLADAAKASGSRRINLYPDYLKPKQERLTLRNIVLSWGGVAAAMLLLTSYVAWQSNDLSNDIEIEKSKGSIMQSELEQYQAKLRQYQPDANKLEAKARLEREVKSKRDSLQSVDKYDESQRTGYSNVMRSLANIGNQEIALSEIRINSHMLSFKGTAKTPSSVPRWVSQFKHEISLVGRTFDDVSIGRNAHNAVTFELIAREENSK